MEVNNLLYANQGLHAICSIFTIENGIIKVLLIKRKNEPYKNEWALVGGAVYNNETLDYAMKREIEEKTGITNIHTYFSYLFDDPFRSKLKRMLAITYIGLIDNKKVKFLKETLKTVDAAWFSLEEIPNLAYDHNFMIEKGIDTLRELILRTDILKNLFPGGFTIPELQKVYEAIFEKKFDRRNFRKKILSLDLVIDTNKTISIDGRKPAKLYRFKNKGITETVF